MSVTDNYFARKADKGKARWSLMPRRAWSLHFPHAEVAPGFSREDLEDVVLSVFPGELLEVLEYGAKKYSAHSWRSIPDAVERYTDALLRHAAADSHDPGSCDEESGLTHRAHMACNAAFLLELLHG